MTRTESPELRQARREAADAQLALRRQNEHCRLAAKSGSKSDLHEAFHARMLASDRAVKANALLRALERAQAAWEGGWDD